MLLQTVLSFFFLLFVFSSAFSIAISQLSLGICTLCFVVVAIGERWMPFVRELKWIWISLGLYLGWLVLVCLLQEEPLRSLDHIREEWLFVVLPVGLYLMRERMNRQRIVIALAIGLLAISLFSLILVATGFQYHWDTGFTPLAEGSVRLRGNFAHALTFGNYAAVGSLFLLALSLTSRDDLSRPVWRLTMAAGLVGVLVTLLGGSRMPILAALTGLVVLSFFVSRKSRVLTLFALVAVILAGGLVTGIRGRFMNDLDRQLDPNHPASRLFIWRVSLNMIEDNPWVGVGPGNFYHEYERRVGPEVFPTHSFSHAHNDILQTAARSGRPGLVTLALVWIFIWRYLRRGYRQSKVGSLDRGMTVAALVGSVVFLATSMTEATFADEEVRVLLMLIWAAGLSVWYNGEGKATGPIPESVA